MWTGRQTLGEIEGAIAKLHRDESQVDTALASATSDAERLRRERGEALRELARVKLDEMAAGRLVRDLDAAEQRVVQILENRKLRIETANTQRQIAITELERAESERHGAAQNVELALADVDELRAQAEAKARITPQWADASKAFAAADAVAVEAEKKAAQNEAELARKKQPYDADPLFTYLWRNGFATPRYAAGNIVRMVDRGMAEFIGFQESRANYAMLIEIPLRLREHATGKRASAGERKALISSIERQAMVEAGVEPKERVLAEARYKLAAADSVAEKKRAILKALDEQRNALVNGTADATYAEALQTIAAADAQDELSTLYREALRTKTPSDDEIVRRIAGLDERLQKTDAEITQLRRTVQDLAKRRVEVERVRDRFQTSGFDHPNATFRNDHDISNILGQILEGAVRSGILWDLLRAGFGTRGPRGRPDFGAPTFPFPFPLPGGGSEGARGGEWREPGTRGGWTPPFDFPSGGGGNSGGSSSSGGGDDDGFSTGGSF